MSVPVLTEVVSACADRSVSACADQSSQYLYWLKNVSTIINFMSVLLQIWFGYYFYLSIIKKNSLKICFSNKYFYIRIIELILRLP